MFILNFYRSIISIVFGFALYMIFHHQWWIWVNATILLRLLWLTIENTVSRIHIQKNFQKHESAFKELFGPYGIRIINKAYSDWQIKRSLAEVFTPNIQSLRNAVEQLQVMDSLFLAGFKPDEDTYLLHDLKLKYGKFRLESITQ
jgi:hypothetical protein